MFPVYGPYPYMNRNQMPHFQNYHPSFNVVPPHLNVDPAKSAISHESWPNYGGYGCVAPCYACCGHGYLPNMYNFRPPYSHYPPQFPLYGYPAIPEAHHTHYGPPPHYSMDQPRYEYDKNVAKTNSCCGCINHPYNLKEGERMKIEEQEQDAQKRGNCAVIPSDQRGCQYPFVWMPHGIARSRDDQNPPESEQQRQRRLTYDGDARDQREGEHISGWNPLDLNKFVQGGGNNWTQNSQNGEGMNHFPYPAFLQIPPTIKSDEAEKKKLKEMNSVPGYAEDMSKDTEGGGTKTKKNIRIKEIPVKEFREEGDEPLGVQNTGGAVGSEPATTGEGKKESENANRKSSSSPRKSKKLLPPVCLRVDPLPRKRSGGGSSRSPSPPGMKEKECKATTKDTSRPKITQDMEACGPVVDKGHMEPQKKEIGAADVTEGNAAQTNDWVMKDKYHSKSVKIPETKFERGAGDRERELLGAVPAVAEEISIEDAECHEHTSEGEKRAAEVQGVDLLRKFEEKERVSATEAALRIQSFYRGYEVRKWKLLEKLKCIAEINRQVNTFRKRINELESSGIGCDNKENVIIGETVMSLLLKLDTVQGLHPSIRENRKAVSRELISLQEKLDALITRTKPGGPKIEYVSDGMCEEQISQVKENNCCDNSYIVKPFDNCTATAAQCDMVPQVSEMVSSLKPEGKVEASDVVKDEVAKKGENDSHFPVEFSAEVPSPTEIDSPMKDEVTKKYQLDPHSGVDLSGDAPLAAGVEIISELRKAGFPCQDIPDLSTNAIEMVGGVDTAPADETDTAPADETDTASEDDKPVVNQLVEQPQKTASEEFLMESENRDAEREGKLLFSQVEQFSKPLAPNQLKHLDHQEELLDEQHWSQMQDQGHPEALERQAILDERVFEERGPQAPVRFIREDNLMGECTEEDVMTHDGNCDSMPVKHNMDEEVAGNEECEQVEGETAPLELESNKMDELGADKEERERVQRENVPLELEFHNIDEVGAEEEGERVEGETMPLEMEFCNVDEMGAEKEGNVQQEGETLPLELKPVMRDGREPDELCATATAGNEIGDAKGDVKECGSMLSRSAPLSDREGSKFSEHVALEEHLQPGSNNDMLVEENKQLREMVGKLLEAGKDQLTVISNLSGRVKDLERKLSKKKTVRPRHRRAVSSRSFSIKPSNENHERKVASVK